MKHKNCPVDNNQDYVLTFKIHDDGPEETKDKGGERQDERSHRQLSAATPAVKFVPGPVKPGSCFIRPTRPDLLQLYSFYDLYAK
jgi:hypothetical protein